MRFVRSHFLDRVFSAGSHISVLRVLSTATAPMTGRMAAREARIHHRSCLQALSRLEGLGIVPRVVGTRDHQFSLNPHSMVVQEGILPLLELELHFAPRLARALRRSCSSFVDSLLLLRHPSSGHGKGVEEFTVCAVVSGIEERTHATAVLDEALPPLQHQFGVRLSPLVLSQSEFIRRGKRGPSVAATLAKDGTVIFGKTKKELGFEVHSPFEAG